MEEAARRPAGWLAAVKVEGGVGCCCYMRAALSCCTTAAALEPRICGDDGGGRAHVLRTVDGAPRHESLLLSL